MNPIFDEIVAELARLPILKDFEYKKYKSSFIQKDKTREIEVHLRRIISCVGWPETNIEPIYTVKFFELHNWFRQFTVLSPRDFRVGATWGCDGERLRLERFFYFRYDKVGYKKELIKLKESVTGCVEYVLNEMSTFEKAYENLVKPILEGQKELQWSADPEYVFVYLALCKKVSPDNYPALREILLKHFHNRVEKRDPNFIPYLPRLNDIMAYLDNELFR